MELINKFIDRVLNTNESFVIYDDNKDNERNYSFIQCNVGKGKYIYGKCGFDKNSLFNIKDTYETVAIVANKKIYLLNIYFFGLFYSHMDSLPENVELLDCERANEYVKNSLFPKFYDSLVIEELTDENLIKTCRNMARQNLLFCKDEAYGWEEAYPSEDLFGEQDIADMLCSLINIEEEANKRFEEKREKYTAKKQIQQKVREFMEDSDTAERWELEIARGLKSVDAQTVTVEFELNGKTASGKFYPSVIINALVRKNSFSSYNFVNGNQGKKVIQELEASDNLWSGNNITCRNITRITYNRKDLYVRDGSAA